MNVVDEPMFVPMVAWAGSMFLTSLTKTLFSVFSPTSRRQLLYFSYSMIISQLGSSFRGRNEHFRSAFTDIWSQPQL